MSQDLTADERAVLDSIVKKLSAGAEKPVVMFTQDEYGGLHELGKLSTSEAKEMVELFRGFKATKTLFSLLRRFVFFVAVPLLAVYEFFRGKVSLTDLFGFFK